MDKRARVLLLAFVVSVISAVAGWAQVYRLGTAVPETVLSGSDLGFRVTARGEAAAIGSFVVRIDGQWVDVTQQVKPVR